MWGKEIYEGNRGQYHRRHAGGHAIPFTRAASSPRPYLDWRGFGTLGERGQSRGAAGRAMPYMQFAPQVQHQGLLAATPAPAETQYRPHLFIERQIPAPPVMEYGTRVAQPERQEPG